MTEQTQEQNLPIRYVGIGASAGGLEALQELFASMPADTGAAFIVVQHLSPDFKSMMPELLSKHTSMPIHEVIDGMQVEKNTIYLTPARKHIVIAEGRMIISDQMHDEQMHMPINAFFNSLAKDQQHKTIAIVLSGTGSDGSQGVKALKESGGLVICQDTNSAKFNGMPMSAQNTGMVDFVLPPSEIGNCLMNYFNLPYIAGDDTITADDEQSREVIFNEIFQLLKQHSSINFSLYKSSTVTRRIERRMAIHQLTTLASYLRLLVSSNREVQALNKELLISVTRFFRDTEAFKRIEEDIIPALVSKAKFTNSIRIWVAGCATGEEAYSYAMLLDEALQLENVECEVKIFATDIDQVALTQAGTGIFTAESLEGISEQRLKQHFSLNGKNYIINSHLRQMVIFASHNIIEDPPFSSMDLVSCRNTLIYFRSIAQKKVLSALYFSVQQNGYLFLGGSETLGEMQMHFEVIDERQRIYQKIDNIKLPISHITNARESSSLSEFSNKLAGQRIPPSNTNNKAVHQHINSVYARLVEEYSPNCIVLDQNHNAVHIYGDVTPYTRGMSAGAVSNKISDIVIQDLSVAVSTAIERCEKDRSDVYYQDVSIKQVDDSAQSIDLSILYVKHDPDSINNHHIIVQFINHKDKIALETKSKITFDANEHSFQRIKDLEAQLIKKQEHLQVTVEELETTNEELQSSNEELMSANEELQSTNEELQSVNEEMYTINSEYQQKISELIEVNNDLDSVMNAIDIGIIFLDDRLNIRKFTTISKEYINLRHTDINRPFHHISHNLDYADLVQDVHSASMEGIKIEKNVKTLDEKHLHISIQPYKQDNQNKQSHSVLITISNI